jgi:FemAB-related protein (PEP-CTERM system-associated)
MTIEIVEGRADAAGTQWDAFVDRQPDGSFYHRFGWKRINEQELGHATSYLEAHAGTELIGVLPLVLTHSRIFGRILCSMPFVNFGGPLAIDGSVTHQLVQTARERAAELDADYLELRCTAPLDTDIPASLQKVSMTLRLDADPDRLWNGFSSKHRNNIRRVYKEGFEVKSGGVELLAEFYSVMQQSWRDLGTPLYAPSYFRAILDEFPEQTRIFVCHRNGAPVAVTFNGHSKATVEGMWAGATPIGRQMNANYVLYWEMIKDACQRGFTSFHLGRSTAGSGAEQFKKKWNTETQQLYWYHHRPDGQYKPVLNVDNPKFQFAIAAWRRLPLWATRMLGPALARSIP